MYAMLHHILFLNIINIYLHAVNITYFNMYFNAANLLYTIPLECFIFILILKALYQYSVILHVDCNLAATALTIVFYLNLF